MKEKTAIIWYHGTHIGNTPQVKGFTCGSVTSVGGDVNDQNVWVLSNIELS